MTVRAQSIDFFESINYNELVRNARQKRETNNKMIFIAKAI